MRVRKAHAIFVLCIVALMVIFLAVKLSTKKENYRKCICTDNQGGRGRTCQDTVTVNNDYVTNKWTEFSELPSKGWSRSSPGDAIWPVSSGCSWPNEVTSDKWTFWDFTQFGS